LDFPSTSANARSTLAHVPRQAIVPHAVDVLDDPELTTLQVQVRPPQRQVLSVN
jgi:hypothetical protein